MFQNFLNKKILIGLLILAFLFLPAINIYLPIVSSQTLSHPEGTKYLTTIMGPANSIGFITPFKTGDDYVSYANVFINGKVVGIEGYGNCKAVPGGYDCDPVFKDCVYAKGLHWNPYNDEIVIASSCPYSIDWVVFYWSVYNP